MNSVQTKKIEPIKKRFLKKKITQVLKITIKNTVFVL